MKFAYIGTLPPHGGGSALLGEALLRGLARRGHSVFAIAPITREAMSNGDPMANAPFPIMRYTIPHFETAPNNPASTDYRALEGRGIATHLHSLLSRTQIDLIISGRETFAWHVAGLAHACDLRWVCLAQGATTWGLLDGTYPHDLREELINRLDHATMVIAVAEHLAERLREVGLKRVIAIPNAVDPQAFAPDAVDSELRQTLGIKSDRVIVAHISNLKSLKRPFDFVHAAAIAIKHNPSLIFVIIGDGEHRAALETECRNLRILDHFRFTGWIPHAQVRRYICLAEMVVMTSEAEALALVYLETQACGRVLISTDIAGAREVIEDGVNGLLFPIGDCVGLATRMLQLAADPALRATIGDSARKIALTRPFESALNRYEAVLCSFA